jgi:UDP-glucose 4-epimerase
MRFGDMDHPRIKKALVTGARGFIGSNLCESLLREGVEVHAVSQSGFFGAPQHSFGTAPSAALESRWWRVDLTDLKSTQRLLLATRPDVVFHLAGLVSGSRDREAVLPMLSQNLVSTVNLMNAAADVDTGRLVLAGSIEVPGAGDADESPCSPYAAAKWAGSAYARMYHALYNSPVVVARMAMVYGPRQWDSTKLVPYVIHSLLRGERLKLSSGKRLVDWIYVDDVVAGLRTIAQAPGIEGRSIDVGSGRVAPIRDVVDELVYIMGGKIEPDYGALPDRPMETEHVANIEETTRLVDWSPAINLSEGLRRTVAWFADESRSSLAAAS